MKGKDGEGLLLMLGPKGKGKGKEEKADKGEDLTPKQLAAEVALGDGDKETRRDALIDLIEMCIADYGED